MTDFRVGLRAALGDIGLYSRLVLPNYALRPYQVVPARAIVESVDKGLGRQFAVVFSRQAGKDEMLAQLLVFLLTRYQLRGGGAVLAAPTFRPQAALSRDRLIARLDNPLTASNWKKRDGYAVTVGKASARFLSAAPGANARGQTADLLLVANEAQDIQPEIWDAVFDPMAASTNATTLFLGTVWSRDTLLARQMRHFEALEQQDGVRRVWRVGWETVAQELPAYGDRVRARIEQFGIGHPFIKTEYCLEELDGEGGLFPPGRLALLRGDHERRHQAEAGKRYALLVDVAGEEEGGGGPGSFTDDSRRDSTALTVIELQPSPPTPLPHAGEGRNGRLHAYRVVDRVAWTGTRHTELHAALVHLARVVWRASVVVVDATGVGAGLASFLSASLSVRSEGYPAIQVVPFVFTQASKSALGWDLLGLIDSGRLTDYRDDSATGTPEGRLTALFWDQMRATTYETVPGPGKLLRWQVPAGRGHDDLVMSLALVATLDNVDWRVRTARGRN